jgi:hypothetical protein
MQQLLVYTRYGYLIFGHPRSAILPFRQNVRQILHFRVVECIELFFMDNRINGSID